MKFTLKKSKILDALAKIQGIANRKTKDAITSCVLIKAFEDGLKFYVTDYETGFIGFYSADVESEGTIAINAKKLFEIVKDFPTEDILVNEVENYWIEIGSHNIQYHLVGMDPVNFPEIPEIEDMPFIEMEARRFKKMVDKTSSITSSPEDKREHIIGVCLETFQKNDENWIKIISTDGNRLAIVEFPCINESGLTLGKSILIQKKGFNELSKIIVPEGNVFIGILNNKLFMKQQRETVSVGMVTGNFPDYSVLIDIKDAKQIIVNRQLFIMTLRRMSIFSTEEYKGVIFNFNDDKMVVSSTNPELGESREELFIEYPSETIEIAFNPRYFIESLSAIEDEKVVLNITNDQKPCLVEGDADKSYQCLIMPMKI